MYPIQTPQPVSAKLSRRPQEPVFRELWKETDPSIRELPGNEVGYAIPNRSVLRGKRPPNCEILATAAWLSAQIVYLSSANGPCLRPSSMQFTNKSYWRRRFSSWTCLNSSGSLSSSTTIWANWSLWVSPLLQGFCSQLCAPSFCDLRTLRSVAIGKANTLLPQLRLRDPGLPVCLKQPFQLRPRRSLPEKRDSCWHLILPPVEHSPHTI